MISAQMFQSIVQSIRSHPEKDDARKSPRVGVNGRATIILLAEHKQAPSMVTVRDLSPKGIGFLFPRRLNVGMRFVLCLTGEFGENKGVICTVTRWAPLSSELCNIGATFDQETVIKTSASEIEMQHAVDELIDRVGAADAPTP